MLDPTPRVLVLPGIGLVAVGETRRAARIAADIAVHTVRAKIWAASIGRYEGLSESDLFDMEYWSLEQAKLLGAAPAPLEGQIALVTGGAGAIGERRARALRAGAIVCPRQGRGAARRRARGSRDAARPCAATSPTRATCETRFCAPPSSSAGWTSWS
jgi:hypothetical protein